jgi:hypothetical protein
VLKSFYSQESVVNKALDINLITVRTDLNDAAWAWIAPYLPAARSGGRPAALSLWEQFPVLGRVIGGYDTFFRTMPDFRHQAGTS